MVTTVPLSDYLDENGNRIVTNGFTSQHAKVTFRGSNNLVELEEGAYFANLNIDFNANNGIFRIGKNLKKRGFSASVRVGDKSSVIIGQGVSATSPVVISAVEGTTVSIGNDVMFATGNQVRSDDGHPIFDVKTGNRINFARDITIGDHVWLAWGATLLGGAVIGEGSVIGANSLVKGEIPNNVVAAGTPAKILRTDIAWERPHIGMTPPFYFPHIDQLEERSIYWRTTEV